MTDCLYCQRATHPGSKDCPHCGMPLPVSTDRARQRRLRRFQWFCVGLTLFCAVMIYWLPRSLG